MVSDFKQPNTMTGIVQNGGGNNIVIANQEFMPASLQRLTVVATHNQHDNTLPAQIIASEVIQPSKPNSTIVKGKLNTNKIKATVLVRLNKAQLIKYIPQYSLRVALPAKAKYFLYSSNLFIMLTS
jgi:hypothetical protein